MPPTVCDLCGSLFFGKRDLKAHRSRVHLEAKWRDPCDECGKEFGSKSDMVRHVRQVHWKVKGIPRSGKCDECGKEFAFKSDALRHMRTVHMKIKNQVCSGKCTMLASHSVLLLNYREFHLLANLGWVDLDLGSSPGTVATYCPSRMVEHPKSKSTQPRFASR